MQILIVGDGLEEMLKIDDPDIVDRYNIFFGPKVRMNGITGQQEVELNPESPEKYKWFVDWARETLAKPPSGLLRYEVSLMANSQKSRHDPFAYKFLYGIDPDTSQGYIYISNFMQNPIHHGVEGTWLYSHSRWDKVIQPLVLESSDDSGKLLEHIDPACVIGPAFLRENGTIEFDWQDEKGVTRSRRRFEESAPDYQKVRYLIGEREVDKQFMLSCWPPRN